MDTSKEYILMCEKAGEIRDKWDKTDYCPPSQEGIHFHKGYMLFCKVEKFSFASVGMVEEVFLPRQDQLQDMIELSKDEIPRCKYLTYYVAAFVDKEYPDYCEQFNSMEQFWLAFVMKEKYSKIWTGKDWEVNGQ